MEPIGSHHAELAFEALQDPAIYTWISARPPVSLASLQGQWLADAGPGQPLDPMNLEWIVLRAKDGICIGKMDAEIGAGGTATNVGYLFFPRYWRHGYATEAVKALAEHLYRYGSREQWAFVTVGNVASERVLERAGFTRDRIVPGNDTIRGQVVDDIKYVWRHDDRSFQLP